MHRGSRKHVLDWVERPEFASEFTQLLEPSGAVVLSDDNWMPLGHSNDEEARLDVHGSKLFGEALDWRDLWQWWLVHNGKANTPNWDVASTCSIGDRRGLVLVEAKAHTRELKLSGKRLESTASQRSVENHERIGEAIAEASSSLAALVPGVTLSRDSHYQLANRVAFSWKLASTGIPVVLVYLGFTGDAGISDVGEPLEDDSHWREVFADHASGVLPNEFLEHEIDCGAARMRMLVRSRPVLSPSRAA